MQTEPGRRDPVFLIVNERAGRGRGALAGTQAQEALASRGVKVVRLTTERHGHAVELARSARAQGASVVAAVGGDGTLHEVLNGLVGDELLRGQAPSAPCPLLGAVPVGSGNDYVKMLGLARSSPHDSALALLEGPAKAVDVGIFEGAASRTGPVAEPELFLNNLGLAFTGDANARIESTRGLPGGMAYFLGAARAFLTYVLRDTEVEVDGRLVYSGRPTIVHVNQGRFCGGGVVFTPEAELDDGLLDVLIMGELSRLGCIINWNAVTSGKGRTLSAVSMFRGASVVVRTLPGELLHADGEVRRFVGNEVRARLAPRAIRVIFSPRHAAESAPIALPVASSPT